MIFFGKLNWRICNQLLGGLLFLALPNVAELLADNQSKKQIIKELGGVASTLQGGGWELQFQLGGQGLTDEGLKHVVSLDNVVVLNLRDTKITSAGLTYLKTLTKLRRLHLERTAVDDGGIQHLAVLSQLEYLNLYGTNITDKSLKALAGLKKLKQLYVWQTGVTDAGVEDLLESLPDLKVSMGVNLSTIIAEKKKDQPEDLSVLKWLPEGGDKKPPKRSISGTFIMVHFENRRSHAVKLYWVDYNGKLKFYADIAAGAKRDQTSYSSAVWHICDKDDRPLGYFVTTQKSCTALIPKD